MEINLSRIMREIYEMENPNPLLFEDFVEIRKMMAADKSEVLKRMEFDADFRTYIKSFLKEIRTNKLYTWYKRKVIDKIMIFQTKNLVKNSDVHKGLLSGLKMPSMPKMPKGGFSSLKKTEKVDQQEENKVKTPSFQGIFRQNDQKQSKMSFLEAMGQINMKNISSLDSFEIEKDIEQQIQEIVHQELEERTIKQFNSTKHENSNHSLTVMVEIFTILKS